MINKTVDEREMYVKLKLLSLYEDYNKRVEVYWYILESFEGLNGFCKEQLIKNQNKKVINENEIVYIQEVLELSITTNELFNLLIQTDNQKFKEHGYTLGFFKEMLYQIDVINGNLELLSRKLNKHGYKKQKEAVAMCYIKLLKVSRKIEKILQVS